MVRTLQWCSQVTNSRIQVTLRVRVRVQVRVTYRENRSRVRVQDSSTPSLGHYIQMGELWLYKGTKWYCIVCRLDILDRNPNIQRTRCGLIQVLVTTLILWRTSTFWKVTNFTTYDGMTLASTTNTQWHSVTFGGNPPTNIQDYSGNVFRWKPWRRK